MCSSVLPKNMTTNDHFQILQLKTCELKVNIHCAGCKAKVKKILNKIEGVYSVDIDAEKQKVKVSGNVDSTTLINKLIKSGKFAQLWPSNDHEITNAGNHLQNLITSLNVPKTRPLGYSRSLEEQLAFDRFLKQSMDFENHARMGWDNRVGDDTSGFIDLEGSQLGGFGGIRTTYNDHQSSLPMFQQQHPGNLIMNRNVQHMHGDTGNAMVHDNMYMNHASPVFRHAHRAHYY